MERNRYRRWLSYVSMHIISACVCVFPISVCQEGSETTHSKAMSMPSFQMVYVLSFTEGIRPLGCRFALFLPELCGCRVCALCGDSRSSIQMLCGLCWIYIVLQQKSENKTKITLHFQRGFTWNYLQAHGNFSLFLLMFYYSINTCEPPQVNILYQQQSRKMKLMEE